jgi:hypothetical protein
MGYDKPEQAKAIVLGTMYANVPKDAPAEDLAGLKKAIDYLSKIRARFSCSIKEGQLAECVTNDKGYRLFTGMVSKYRDGKNQPDFCLVARTPQPTQGASKSAPRAKPTAKKEENTNNCPF